MRAPSVVRDELRDTTATLFDHLARLDDPDTSQAAAVGDRTSIEQRALEIIAAHGWTGAICDQVHAVMVAEGWQQKWGSTSRRITSLAKAGRVELAGERPGDSGRMQRAWRVPAYMTEGEKP